MYDEIIEGTKPVTTKAVTTNNTSTNFYVLLVFLLITMALSIAVSIYCCFIEYQTKTKNLYYLASTPLAQY